jgi:hypothetical protein
MVAKDHPFLFHDFERLAYGGSADAETGCQVIL